MPASVAGLVVVSGVVVDMTVSFRDLVVCATRSCSSRVHFAPVKCPGLPDESD
jgi:hypothetical protein